MQYTILALLATAATYASAQSTPASVASSASASSTPIGAVVPVGGDCTPGGTPCALGSQCYAVNSMLIPRCGNFQASCTSDQQCAFNTCQQGFCNGFIASSSPTTTPTSTPGFQPAPSPTVTAPAGSLPLGAQCNPYVEPSQCANGVQCWASNAGLIARCGNFNAVCSSDAQCAYNACSDGLCRGAPLSSMSGNATISMRPSGSATASASGNVTRSATGSPSRTSSPTQFTGAASVVTLVPEVMAVVMGAIAWAF